MLNICWTSRREADGFSLAPEQWKNFHLTDHCSLRLFITELPSATWSALSFPSVKNYLDFFFQIQGNKKLGGLCKCFHI